MGKHEGWAQPSSSGLLVPNGLLPGEAASVVQVLDSERWSKAEERTGELIACVQPNPPSEERRNAVATYVQRLVVKCFPCEVFTFGSVPLKTYLPDGDIDLTAFSKNQNLKDTWAHQVRDMLESEEKNENAEFRVKEVQYIQAEVKIIKCLVENIVVDVSFNQLGGLCTLCFLEEVDNLIKQNHLFKRSIILVKAWCYYESRILGAHHGLISTYALETLVLYIFHVFNKSFAGPLEVLYRFLEFFSKFDWDNFCVSLRGPVPISSLPDVTAEPPRRDGGELLLDEQFLNACNSVYAVFPSGQDNQGQPFISKHFNVIDPLRVNNNLGRSVSRGNFFRIRSAFAYGAKRLARLLHCPKENILHEINDFFTNTWDRHGHGHRPDAPENELWRLRLPLPNTEQLYGSGNARNSPNSKNDDNFSSSEAKIDFGLQNVSSHHINSSLESTYRISDSSMSRQSQKSYGNLSNSRSTNQSRREVNSKQVGNADKDNRSSRPDNIVNDVKGRYLIGRTHSSPELTDSSNDVSSRVRQNRVPESGKNQNSSARTDNSRRKTMEHDPPSQEIRSSANVLPFGRPIASHQTIDADDSNSASNSHHEDDVRLGVLGEDFASISGTQGMHQMEQDIVNAIASSQLHGFNGQVHMPLSLPHGHFPLNIFPMGYAPSHWSANMPFPHGLVSPPLTHYFPNIGLASNLEDSVEPGDQNFGSTDANSVEVGHDFWPDQEGASTGGFNIENGNFENIRSDDQPQSTLMPYNVSPSSRVVSSGGYSRSAHPMVPKDNQVSSREDHVDAGTRVNESYVDERPTSSRSLRGTQSGSLKSKTSSESSWDGSSAKTSKPLKEKKGRKAGSSAVTSTMHGKNKSSSDQSSTQADDDGRDWNTLSTGGPEAAERSSGPQHVSSLHVPMHSMPGFESAQTSGPDSVLPFPQVLLGPSSRQRPMDNSGLIAFYPTGPPVPIVAFSVPIRNESGSSEASNSHFDGEERSATSDPGLNFETLDRSEPLEAATNSMGQVASIEPIEQKSDVLSSDFTSHWHNLQYGRSCQNSRCPVIYPSHGVLPPVYVQGHIPWDGTGRLVSANVNFFSQLYGSRLVPIPQLQPVSNGPASVYNVDEIPRYRAGTGTYLPNPKVSRERHSSTRRGNYSYDRSDHHGDRDGNWNVSSKPKASGRSHSRNQADKLASRSDRVAAGDTQAERTLSSSRHGSLSSYNSQTSTVRSNTAPVGPANVAYSMYHLPAVNPSMVSPNGPALPSVVMLYPYDHNGAYNTPSEQLEFGSLGSVGLSGLNDVSQLNDGNRLNGAMEEQKFPVSRNSPEQPSSPHLRR